MIRYILAALLLAMPALAQTGNLSGGSVKSTGSTTSRTLAARFAEVVNVKDFGATGDGTTDDSAAFTSAINRSNTLLAAGTPVSISIPAGIYRVVSALPQFVRGGCLAGDGTNKTYIKVDTSYSGDVFSWSEAWYSAQYFTTTIDAANAKASACVTGLTVFGTNASGNTQNAFRFYDRNDGVLFRDVDVWHLNGNCLSIGRVSATPQGYMRESNFWGLRCFSTGTASLPAVEISSTTASGSDATNELKFFALDVFDSGGVGLSISNPNNFSATRLIDFHSLRVEQSQDDNIRVGSASDAGQVHTVRFYGLQSITPGDTNADKYGLWIDTTGIQLYDIMVAGGELGPCEAATSCRGLYLNNTRLTKIQLGNISSTGTDVTIGASYGWSNVIDGANEEQNWTWSIDSGVLGKVAIPIYKYGNPVTGTYPTPAVTAAYHDSTATFGNAPGAGAVDLQTQRSDASQVASGAGAALVAGSGNYGQGALCYIIGGSSNVCTGTASSALGVSATDRGRYAFHSKASGQFASRGDSQYGETILRCTTSTTSACRLTADAAAAGSANCVNIPNATASSVIVTLTAVDNSAAGNNYTAVWGGGSIAPHLLTRGANAASTLVDGVATTITPDATRSNGTVGGLAATIAADTTNGCLDVTFTPPTANAVKWNAIGYVRVTGEVQ